jgi:hypothetical protein
LFRKIRPTETHKKADAVRSAAFEDLNYAVSIAPIVRSVARGDGSFNVLTTVAFSAARD